MTGFRATQLVTDATDPDLINPWGIVGSEGLFWISDNGTGAMSIYDGDGRQSPNYPPGRFAPGPGITGVAHIEAATGSTEFLVKCTDGQLEPAEFILASEDGVLIALSDHSPKEGRKVVDRSSVGAKYKGVAVLEATSGAMLLAADFVNARIDVFNDQFKRTSALAFVDPEMPAGYGPFNVMVANGVVYVMYAQIGKDGDEAQGPGLGQVTIFDAMGNVMNRIKSDLFNAPWGLAIAPAGSKMADAAARATLMIGNFGDGHVTKFDVDTLAPLGQLMDSANAPLAFPGLWGLAMGSADAGDPNALYYTAGPNGEAGGVFGRVDANEGTTTTGYRFPLRETFP